MIKYEVEVNELGTFWYLNDELHREDGPAVEYTKGTKEWYLNGRRHRVDGPAIEYADGDKEWYQYGQEYTEQEFLKLTQPIKDMTVDDMISTLKDFILAVEQLQDKSQAYDLFVSSTSDEVRDLIYSLVDSDESEPFRAAMQLMGYADF